MRITSLKQLGLAGSIIAAMFIATPASADTVICPDPILSVNAPRQYQTTGALDCVWVDENIGQGQPANDGFLLGHATNDLAYGQVDLNGAAAPGMETFGLTWTTIDSVNFGNNAFPGFSGLSFTNVDSNSFDWSLTNTSFEYYALGLKDGGNPQAAVFLLNGTSGSAEILTQGGWSHVVLYGSGTPGCNPCFDIPEPASLALTGMALAAFGIVRRRRQV